MANGQSGRLPAWLKPIALIVGPAAVMTAGIMGAGSTTALVLAGTWFRYDLLWAALIILPAVVVCLDSGARVGIMSGGKGMLSVIRDEIHGSLTWFILVVMILFNLFVNMAQMSVMTESALAFAGEYEPSQTTTLLVTVALTAVTLLVVLGGGYKRIEKVMSGLCFFIFICFLVVALQAIFTQFDAILGGLAFVLPGEVTDGQSKRDGFKALMKIVGGALAAAPILSFSYFSSDANYTAKDIPRAFWKTVLALGVLFGLYSVAVLVAGGFALHPRPDHLAIEEVHKAGQVLDSAMPGGLGALGPKLFELGLLACGFTTLVVVAQLMCYFCLDAVGLDWRYRPDNNRFRLLLAAWVAVPALLAPFWKFPALLKIILLMGINAILVPVAIVVILYLVNRRSLMREYKAGIGRNLWLLASLAFAVWLIVQKGPGMIDDFVDSWRKTFGG